MPKTPPNWNQSDYATVAERIARFRTAYPSGRIETELQARDTRQVTFRAAVYRTADEARPAATGWASEREGDGDVNAVACLENTETSAIGRALANLGFSASRDRPEREELERAAGQAAGSTVRVVHGSPAAPAAGAGHPGTEPSRRSAASDDADTKRRVAFDARQQHASAVHDAMIAVEAAERAGLPAAEVERHRRALAARLVPPSHVARIERELRGWMEAQFRDPARLEVAPDPDGDLPPIPDGDANDAVDAGQRR